MPFKLGSPPRVRGKVRGVIGEFDVVGITPACAGKRIKAQLQAVVKRDHPRVCGEKCRSTLGGRAVSGSPPRVRGKVTLLYALADKEGITPACAGKSFFGYLVGAFSKDHPRVCGEKCGSDCTISVRARITPACAGKRLKRSHSIGHFSCILCLFHSVLHRASVSGGSRAGPCAPPCLPAQNAVPV